MAVTRLAIKVYSPIVSYIPEEITAHQKRIKELNEDIAEADKSKKDAQGKVNAQQKIVDDFWYPHKYPQPGTSQSRMFNYYNATNKLNDLKNNFVKAEEHYNDLIAQRDGIQSALNQVTETNKYNTSKRYVGYYTSAAEHSASSMTFEFETEQMGGLKSWVVTFKNMPLEPFDINMEFQFFVDGYHWYTGYVTEFDSFTNNKSTIQVKGVGYWDRLKTARIGKDGIAQSTYAFLVDVLKALSKELQKLYGFIHSENHFFGVPDNLELNDIKFKEINYAEAVSTCINLINANRKSTYYASVNNDRSLAIGYVGMYHRNKNVLVEGYNYHESEIEFDSSNIVNSVTTAFKDSNKKVASGLYEDKPSIVKYGTRSAKIIVNSSTQVTSANLLGKSIVERLKEPVTRLSLKNVEVKDYYPFNFAHEYKFISSPRQNVVNLKTFWETEYWRVVRGTVVLDERRLDAHKSLKLTPSISTIFTIAIHTFTTPIFAPNKIIGHFYVEKTTNYHIALSFYDSYGNTMTYQISDASPDSWHKIELDTKPSFCSDLMTVKKSAESKPELFHIHSPTAEDDDVMRVECLGKIGLFNINKIKITATNYFDKNPSYLFNNFSVIAENNQHYDLELISAKYTIGHTKTCELEFGDKRNTLVDAFKTEVERAGITIDFATK